MIDNPGPLDPMHASTFAGGRYDAVVLTEDVVLYRAGDADGERLGQFFTHEPPQSVAAVRMDSAVKREWLDANGHYPVGHSSAASSRINAVYGVRIPAGTTDYRVRSSFLSPGRFRVWKFSVRRHGCHDRVSED